MEFKTFLFVAALAASVHGSHLEEDRQLTCEKGLNTLIAMPYAAFSCAAEAFGAEFNTTKPKLPNSFVKLVDRRIAKVDILSDLDLFHNWFCKDFNVSMEIVNSHPDFNFSESQLPVYMKCYHDKLTDTIDNEVCVKNNTLAQKLEIEKFNCMIDALGTDDRCLIEVLNTTLEHSGEITSWLCADESHAEKFVIAEMMCAHAKEDSSETFSICMDNASKKLVKP